MAMTGGQSYLVYTGYGNGNYNNPIKVYVYVKHSQNMEKNQSTITCGLYVTTPSAGYEIGPWDDYHGSYLGTTSNTFNGSFSLFAGTKWIVEDKSFTVDHNPDGTKTATIYWKWGVNSSWGRIQDPLGSFDITLPTIPRASKPALSAYSVPMDSEVTIYTNRASTAFTHTLRYQFGESGTISTGVKDSFKWKVPLSLAKQIKSKTKDNGTIYCDTYNGTTLIGTNSVIVELTVPDNDTTKPAMNPVMTPSGSLPSAFAGKYIQGKTGVSVAFNATSEYSTVESCSMSVESKTYSGDPATSQAVGTSGSVPVSITAKDARGYARAVSESISVYAYTSPRLKDVSVYRSNSGGTETSGGTYLHIKFEKSFSSIDGLNSCTAQFRVKTETGQYGEWTELSGNSYEGNLAGYVEDTDTAYTVQIAVSDTIGDRTEYTYKLPSAFHTVHLAKGGKGIAFGKKSDKNGFECFMDALFSKFAKFTGAATFEGATTVSGKATLSGGVSGNTTFDNGITVKGKASLDGGVSGDTTFEDSVDIKKGCSVAGNLDLTNEVDTSYPMPYATIGNAGKWKLMGYGENYNYVTGLIPNADGRQFAIWSIDYQKGILITSSNSGFSMTIDGNAVLHSGNHANASDLLLNWTTLANNSSVQFAASKSYYAYVVYSYVGNAFFSSTVCTHMLTQPMCVCSQGENYPFTLSRSGDTCTLSRGGTAAVSYLVFGLR